MLRFLASASLVLFLVLPAQAEELKIAFWNLENLFDEFRDGAAPSAEVFGNPAELDEKLKKDAEVIRALDADIVGLMEVENRHILGRLCSRYLDGDGYEYHTLIDETDDRGIDCALIARRPFLAQSFAVPEFDRGILVGRFALDGKPLYVVVNHWKSRYGGGEDLRLKCSRRVEQIVNEILPAYEGAPVPVVVGGDLNDEDHDVAVARLESEAGLLNLLKDKKQGDRWTLPYWDRRADRVLYQGFDHLLINPTLARGDGIRLVPGSAKVPRFPFMLRTRPINGRNVPWPDDDYPGHIGRSDHFPVVLKVTTSPAPGE